MTHRQFLAWEAWLDSEWNRPSRSDHYAMQIAQRLDLIRGMFSKAQRSTKLGDYKIPFEFITAQIRAERDERMAELSVAAAKGVWVARLGIKPEQLIVKTRPQDG